MFIYWISWQDDIPSIEGIETLISNALNTNVTLANTDELKNIKRPPVIKKYGLTREQCTAYFQDENPKSLTGGYDNTRRVCQETNPNTGIWIKTPRQLTEKEVTQYETVTIYGPIKYKYEHTNVVTNVSRYDRKSVLGICLVISVLITSVIYQQYDHEPIFSLLILIVLTITSIIFTNQIL